MFIALLVIFKISWLLIHKTALWDDLPVIDLFFSSNLISFVLPYDTRIGACKPFCLCQLTHYALSLEGTGLALKETSVSLVSAWFSSQWYVKRLVLIPSREFQWHSSGQLLRDFLWHHSEWFSTCQAPDCGTSINFSTIQWAQSIQQGLNLLCCIPTFFLGYCLSHQDGSYFPYLLFL